MRVRTPTRGRLVVEVDPAADRPPDRPARLRLGAGRLATLLTNLVLLLSGLLSSVLISRALGPAGRGEYTTWQTWAGTAAILAIGGLPQVLVLDTMTVGRRWLGQTFTLLAATLTTGLIVVVGIAAVLRPGAAVFVAAILVVAANQFAAVGAAEAQRRGRMVGEFNLVRMAPQVAALLAMGALLLRGSSSSTTWLLAVAGAQTVGTAIWVVVTAGWRRSYYASSRRTLLQAAKLIPGNCATMLQYRYDLLVLAAVLPAEQVGFYAVGGAAQSAVLAAGQACGMHWFAKQRRDHPGRRTALKRELWRVTAVSLVMAVLLAATSTAWVAHFYGGAFVPAVPTVVVLCGVGVLQSLDYLLAHECLMAGLGGRIARYRMPSLALTTIGLAVGLHLSWAVPALAVVPGVGYVLSTGAFLRASGIGLPRVIGRAASRGGMR